MLNKLKNSFLRFMTGRYGPDALYKFLFYVYILLIVLNLFFKNAIIHYSALAVLIYMMFRFFSKNIAKRQAENIKYWNTKEKIRKWVNLQKNKFRYRKTHIYRKCPNCRANIKLPRKKGNHICNCPKCKKGFNVSVK